MSWPIRAQTECGRLALAPPSQSVRSTPKPTADTKEHGCLCPRVVAAYDKRHELGSRECGQIVITIIRKRCDLVNMTKNGPASSPWARVEHLSAHDPIQSY